MIENIEDFISSMQQNESPNKYNSNTKRQKRLRNLIRTNIPELPHIKGKEIKEIRESIDCSQALFAEILGVSKNTVEYWESGKNVPNGSAQRLLALIKNKKVDFIKEDLQKIGLLIR